MNTNTITLTTRDQIALDVFKIAVSGYQRFLPIDAHAKIASASYHAADAFLAEQAKQNATPTLPDAPTERKTVPPVAGRKFYTRSGEVAEITHGHGIHVPFWGNIGGRLFPIPLAGDGKSTDPANDLVSECPF